MREPRIFLSHSVDDSAWCQSLVSDLQAAGFDTWFDQEDLGTGAVWLEEIERELQAREVFLIVLSPSAWRSQWVRDELRLAFVTNRRVIPVLLRRTIVDGFILTRQWINAEGIDHAAVASRILATLRSPVQNLAPITALVIDDLELNQEALSIVIERTFAKVNTEFESGAGRKLVVDSARTYDEAYAKIAKYSQSRAPLVVVTDLLLQEQSGGYFILEFIDSTFFQNTSEYLAKCPLIIYSRIDRANRLPKRPHTFVIDRIPLRGESSLLKLRAALFDCLSTVVADNS